MARTNTPTATDVQTPALPWKVAYNGTATAMLTPASAIKFASSLLKQGQQVTIQHFVNGDWHTAEMEQAKAMQKVGGFNQGAVASLTQFDEFIHYILKNAAKKNGLQGDVVSEYTIQFVSTAREMGVTRATIEQALAAYYPEHQE
jgi:hypothetical protein